MFNLTDRPRGSLFTLKYHHGLCIYEKKLTDKVSLDIAGKSCTYFKWLILDESENNLGKLRILRKCQS